MAEEVKAELIAEVLKFGKKLRLAVIKIGENPVTEKFLEQKKISLPSVKSEKMKNPVYASESSNPCRHFLDLSVSSF